MSVCGWCEFPIGPRERAVSRDVGGHEVLVHSDPGTGFGESCADRLDDAAYATQGKRDEAAISRAADRAHSERLVAQVAEMALRYVSRAPMDDKHALSLWAEDFARNCLAGLQGETI